MRIALAQLNPTVGALRANAGLVLDAAQRAAQQGAQLLITPELVLTGYPPQDLLFDPRFIEEHNQELASLAKRLPLPILLGCIQPAEQTSTTMDDALWQVPPCSGQPLSNAAVFLSAGKIQAIARKSLLPTYDVFDEWRYFRPGDPLLLSHAGVNLGVTVCEDIWDEGYARQPVGELVAQGAQAIVNLSASPWHNGQVQARWKVIQRLVALYGLPVIYANLVGGQDELVFDGRSLVVDQTGRLQHIGRAWQEDLLVFDLPLAEPAPFEQRLDDCEEAELMAALVCGLRDYAAKSGFATAVLGLSGGVDSSLVACIAARAIGAHNVTAIAMPSRHTAAQSSEDAALLARQLGIRLCSIPIEESVVLAAHRFEAACGPYLSSLTSENVQSRERGKILMEYSNDRGALLLATGNKTEYALGYSTLYGDMCGGLAVIGDLNKLEVYRLANWVNSEAGQELIPRRVIERAPSAELAPDQVDPFDYGVIAPLVDAVLEQHLTTEELQKQGFMPDDIKLVRRLLRVSEFKRKQAAPILRVSARAFGIGRRMPIVNAFE